MSENNNEKNVTGSPYMFQTRMEVRDYECDIQGIVNNANYLHLRIRRAESPKALSPGHRPGYGERAGSPCKGKSSNMI